GQRAGANTPVRIRKRGTDMENVTVGHQAPRPVTEFGSTVTALQPGKNGTGVLAPGTVINQYELIREIGSGGMGQGFLARDMKLGRRVAIKFLQTTDAELTQRFILEARTTASCGHENIVIIHDVGEYRQLPYMVLEYLQGQSLKSLVNGQRMS